ncbi:MAG TPA: hypothetical protein VHB27_16055 [Rhodopila sp.]|uniref:hypothetical protein n=1 Tax=Rhodopila sp. TaxID=2480087 RepID=UPI002C28E701|nr:hypothetical protein [Rhodopila sp.]HVY16738.1 hypothetical protein [Rhodopila sp.]
MDIHVHEEDACLVFGITPMAQAWGKPSAGIGKYRCETWMARYGIDTKSRMMDMAASAYDGQGSITGPAGGK